MDSNDPKHTRIEKRVSPESFIRAFPLPMTPAAGGEPEFHLVPPADPGAALPEKRWRIVLSPVEKPYEVMGLELRADVVLGSAPEPDADIHVNLAPWQGEARGVSLRHALLRPGKDKLFLMDLGSTNGTHYNGMPLSADRVQAVQPGDLITLGRLHLRVKKVEQIDAAPSQPPLSE